MEIRDARADELDIVRGLLDEYARWVNVDLSFQDFARECRELPGDYAPPRGTLLLGLDNGEVVGMVALRAKSGERCEMKRLFVRPSARGLGVGRALIARLLDEARQRGYKEIVLDTLPVMQSAQELYAALGFRDIDPYYPSPVPVPGTRFMALAL